MEKNGSAKRGNVSAGSDDRDHPGSRQNTKTSSWTLNTMSRLATAIAEIRKRWRNRTASNSSSRTQRLKCTSEILSLLRSLVLSIFFFLTAIALSVIIVRQLTTNSVVVEPISVPDTLAKQGYTPKIFGQRIVDEIFKIQREATTIKERRGLMPEWSQLDFEMPGAGLSIKAIGRIIKESLGIPGTRISGEVVMENQEFRLRLRVNGGRHTAEVPPLPAEKLGDMVHRGAQETVKTIDPFLLASYFHAINNQAAMMEMIKYCLANDLVQDDPWANNLWGIHLADKDDTIGAIKKYRAAVKIDPEFALAYHNWGNALEKQGKYKAAIEKYRQSIDLDPDFTLAYINWGIALSEWGIQYSQQRKYKEAIEKFEAAVQKNPRHAPAYTYWGKIYYQEKKYKEAIEKYRKAVEIDPTSAQTYFYLGNAFEKLDDQKEAIESYKQALKLKPDEYNFLQKRIKKLQGDQTGG